MNINKLEDRLWWLTKRLEFVLSIQPIPRREVELLEDLIKFTKQDIEEIKNENS